MRYERLNLCQAATFADGEDGVFEPVYLTPISGHPPPLVVATPGLADLAERVSGRLTVLVGVDLECDSQTRMAECDLRVRAGAPRFLGKVAVVCRRW
jgi:hypothetical protein